MARFFGRYEHSLDDKGRVILPAKFRGQFEHGGYLTEYQDGCLSLWTPDEFELQMESMLQRANSGRSDRNLVRLWASTSHELEIDRQGRMAIPARLREYAGLVGDVLVLGAIDRVELWNRDSWDEKVLPEEERLTQGDDGGVTRGAGMSCDTEPMERPRVALVPVPPARPPTTDSAASMAGTDRTARIKRMEGAPSEGSPHRPCSHRSGPLSTFRVPRAARRLTNRGWPRWPVTMFTSNASGPCAVPRPDRWKNPPPPTSRVIVAALHPLASCRSGDCG